jgi:hypothetical protein
MGKNGGWFENRRDTIGRRKSLFSGDTRFVTDLRRDQVKRLTEILHIDNTRAKHMDEVVKRMIHELPKNMRRDRWSSTNKDLCDTHGRCVQSRPEGSRSPPSQVRRVPGLAEASRYIDRAKTTGYTGHVDEA